MNKLAKKVSSKDVIFEGYTVYGRYYDRLAYAVCRWWLYPAFRIGWVFTETKCRFYHWLIVKGIMHTPIGSQMQFRDIFTKNKKGENT